MSTSRGVILSLVRIRVAVAVDLDAQPGSGAVEVGDIPVEERVLPPDVDAELVIPDGGPEALLGGCGGMAGLARVAQESGGQAEKRRPPWHQ